MRCCGARFGSCSSQPATRSSTRPMGTPDCGCTASRGPTSWSSTDTSPGTGVFGTLSGLSAADASRKGGPGHTTIAGHVHHLTSSLALSTRGLRGESTSRDRSGSWTVSAVDDAEWAALRARLHDEYATLFVAVETHARWDEDALAVAIGAIAHTAYHLGAIRQRLPARRRGSVRAIKG